MNTRKRIPISFDKNWHENEGCRSQFLWGKRRAFLEFWSCHPENFEKYLRLVYDNKGLLQENKNKRSSNQLRNWNTIPLNEPERNFFKFIRLSYSILKNLAVYVSPWIMIPVLPEQQMHKYPFFKWVFNYSYSNKKFTCNDVEIH